MHIVMYLLSSGLHVKLCVECLFTLMFTCTLKDIFT